MNRVNATIAIMFSLALIAGYFLNKISQDAFVGLGTAAVMYFFPKVSK